MPADVPEFRYGMRFWFRPLLPTRFRSVMIQPAVSRLLAIHPIFIQAIVIFLNREGGEQ
jgi:hypothetical protein